jgi:hypothetical protein
MTADNFPLIIAEKHEREFTVRLANLFGIPKINGATVWDKLLYSINRLVSVVWTHHVYCAVRTELLNIL